VLPEELRVEERHLDGVADVLDLAAEPPDVLIGDVGDLLEHQLLDLFLREPFQDVARPRIVEERIARPEALAAELPRDDGHHLLIAPTEDDHTLLAEKLLHRDDLPLAILFEHLDHVEGLVQDHLGAAVQTGAVDLGAHVDAHLPAGREDVGGAILLLREEHAEGGGWPGELLDLLLQGLDLLALAFQRCDEPLVLAQGLGHLPLRLEQSLLEDPHLPRRGVLALAEDGNLVLKEPKLSLELVDLFLVVARLRVLLHRRIPFLPGVYPGGLGHR
jgi:hypothetical protein